uniref:Uncharacterized protein n=1 Tax=Arundo donax TaxID=35708 RepID=A0A0A9AES2_ARUDO
MSSYHAIASWLVAPNKHLLADDCICVGMWDSCGEKYHNFQF